MSFFTRNRISRPVAAAAPIGDIQFQNTTVFVRNSVIQATGSQYGPTVLQHLTEIMSFPEGQALFNAMTPCGKRQVVKYGGANVNQAAGGGVASYKLLRRYHDTHDSANFATELAHTITSSGHNKRWLAEQCYRTRLPTWSGATSPSPFSLLVRPPAPPRPPGAPKPLPATPADLAERAIDGWLAGGPLPSRDEMDILCIVLQPWLRNGTGTNSLISYDPHKVLVAGVSRPPQVALYHELVHALYNAQGAQLGREDSIQETNGGRLFELMAVGLPPFNTCPVGENQFRAALNVVLRPQYP